MTRAKILIVPAMPSTNQMCPRAARDFDVGTSVVQGVTTKPQKPGSILGLNRDNGREKGNLYRYIDIYILYIYLEDPIYRVVVGRWFGFRPSRLAAIWRSKFWPKFPGAILTILHTDFYQRVP